jgi:hypothetical protein
MTSALSLRVFARAPPRELALIAARLPCQNIRSHMVHIMRACSAQRPIDSHPLCKMQSASTAPDDAHHSRAKHGVRGSGERASGAADPART